MQDGLDAATGTRERILDAAEQLFSRVGFNGASLRAITTDAGANLAAVHYHFGSKDDLIQAVFARRLEPLNGERLGLLDELEARAGEAPVDLEAIIRAFLAPALRLAVASEDRRVVMSLLGQAISQPDPKIRSLFIAQFALVGQRFRLALGRALPELPAEQVFWRLMFTVGAMVHTMTLSQHLEEFSGGLCRDGDVETMVRQLVPFIVAGMHAQPAPKVEPS